MRRRELLTGLAAGLGFGVGAACSRRSSSLETIRVGAVRRLSTADLHLGYELGYFRRAGFDLEIHQSGTQLNSVALLAGNKLDVYFAGCNATLLNAIARGLAIRIVAGRQIVSATCHEVGKIYALRRNFPQGLADLKLLKGKRVGVSLAVGMTHFALDAQMRSVGLSIDDVTKVPLDTRQNVAGLMGGNVDALIGTGDYERDLDELPEIVHTPGISRMYPSFQHTFVTFGKSLLEGGVERGARFLSAYLHGVREFRAGKTPRFVEEFARSWGLDVKRALGSCRSSVAEDGMIDVDSLRTLADWYVGRKYLIRALDVAEMVDRRFIERAHES